MVIIKYKPTSGLLQIPPFDSLSYSLSTGDKPLVAKVIDFQIQNNGSKLTFLPGVLVRFFNPISWFILKQRLVYTKTTFVGLY